MSTESLSKDSSLFLVRLWAERDGGSDGNERSDNARRGKVLHVLSGEAHHFHDWAGLIAQMEMMLSQFENAPGAVASEQPIPAP
ncbi:MAG TPA: hypothetical protein VJ183_13315 [Chloroflexia bacterium]|nr:hypothetical protein [Chloroflexia bacterium]